MFFIFDPFFTYFQLILHQYDNMVPIEHFYIPNSSHVCPPIHPAYHNMKLQHIQRFNRWNMDTFVFLTPFLLIFSSFCNNMTTWCLYNTFKLQIIYMFIHPSTQPTKIWSYIISRDLIGKIWTPWLANQNYQFSSIFRNFANFGYF